MPSETCISVVYVVNWKESKSRREEEKVVTADQSTVVFNCISPGNHKMLTLFSTGLVDSTSYIVFTEMFYLNKTKEMIKS